MVLPLKEQILDAIELADYQSAILKLKAYLPEDSKDQRDVSLISSRYNLCTKNLGLGLISHDDYSMEMSRIGYSLIHLLEGEFVEEDLEASPEKLESLPIKTIQVQNTTNDPEKEKEQKTSPPEKSISPKEEKQVQSKKKKWILIPLLLIVGLITIYGIAWMMDQTSPRATPIETEAVKVKSLLETKYLKPGQEHTNRNTRLYVKYERKTASRSILLMDRSWDSTDIETIGVSQTQRFDYDNGNKKFMVEISRVNQGEQIKLSVWSE